MTEQQIRIFTSKDGQAQLEVALQQETVWLHQSQMAALFDTSTDNVGLHLKNIYQEGELKENPTTEDFSVVRPATRGWPDIGTCHHRTGLR